MPHHVYTGVGETRHLSPEPIGCRRLMSLRPLWALLATLLTVMWSADVAWADAGQVPEGSPWTWWVPDPVGWTLLVVLGYLYAAGLRSWKHRSRPVHRWQVISFYAGLSLLSLALVSPLDPLSDQMFFIHQIQHVLLRIAGPVLLLLGAPLTPVLRGLPGDIRMGAVRRVVSNPAARAIYQQLTHPVWVPVVFLGMLYFWQIPELHDPAVESIWVHYVMHFTMTASGVLFWWLIIDPKPHRSSVHYGVRVLIMGLSVLPNTVLGAIVTFADSPLYQSYGPTRLWGIDALDDQRWGGLIMWLTADMMTVVAAAILFSMWYAREQSGGYAGAHRTARRRVDVARQGSERVGRVGK